MVVRTTLLLALAHFAAAQPPPPVELPYKLNAGGPALPALGYAADDPTNDAQAFFTGSSFTFTSNAPVTVPAGANNAQIYLTERVGLGNLTFIALVPSGKTFTVTTKHAESYFTQAGKRSFGIEINGVVKETNVDIFDRVGRDVALDLTFDNVLPEVDQAVDTITITFVGILDKPIVNGIEINEAPSKPPATIRKINVGGPAIDDYEADPVDLITGSKGFTFTSQAPVTGVPAGGNMDVFKTERVAVGTLTYVIPVSEGTYTVTTKHAESYFNAPSKRLFAIEINGEVKDDPVDIFTRAGGRDVALELAFRGIKPVNGVITIKFVPDRQKPIVNSIILAGGSVTMTPTPTASPTPDAPAKCPPDASSETSLLKTNAGGPALADIGFTADDPSLIVSFPKGNTYMGGPLMGTDPLALVYKTERWSPQTLTYRVAVPAAGTYIVRTYHSEGFFNEANKREFHLEIEGTRTNANVDVFAASGGMDKPLVLTNAVTVSGATPSIEIKFVKVAQNPAVNGISISRCMAQSQPVLPPCSSGTTGSLLKMNVGGEALADIGYAEDDVSLIEGPKGIVYTSDGAINAGPSVTNAEVLKTERFTFGQSLEYKIPVPAAGVYTVKTLFSEGFHNAPGIRLQNVEIDGTVTEKNVDIFGSSGGKNKALGFAHLVTKTTASEISVKVVRVKSNPLLNAISVSGCLCEGFACASPSPSLSSTPPPPGNDFKMNVGGPAIAALGYVADDPSLIIGPTGRVYPSSADVTVPVGDNNMQVYKTERYAQRTKLTYKFTRPAGTYTVETLHAESFFSAPGKRKFGIKINGVMKETGIDIFASVGQNVALVKRYESIQIFQADNSITIELINEVENPALNAIHLISTEPTFYLPPCGFGTGGQNQIAGEIRPFCSPPPTPLPSVTPSAS